MKKKYKYGFSLAEILIAFVLVSMLVTVFAPVMTKKAQQRGNADPNCTNGIKLITQDYTEPGTYSFVLPENTLGSARITLVAGGGMGSDAEIIKDDNGNIVSYISGSGGTAGEYISFIATKLKSGKKYQFSVGAGGKKGKKELTGDGDYTTFGFAPGEEPHAIVSQHLDNPRHYEMLIYSYAIGGKKAGSIDNSFENIDKKLYAIQSKGSHGKEGGRNINPGAGGGNPIYSDTIIGGAPGDVCLDGGCNPNGRQGSGYQPSGLSKTGFIAGTGGGGGGFDGATKTAGYGGQGGSGYARIEYAVRCR